VTQFWINFIFHRLQQGSQFKLLRGHIRTYKLIGGSHYDADATTAVFETYQKQLLHLISYERTHEL